MPNSALPGRGSPGPESPDPASPAHAVARAEALATLGRWAAVAEATRAGLAADPAHPTLLCLLAQARFNLDDAAGTLDAAEQAAGALGADVVTQAWAHRLRTCALDMLGRRAAADAALAEALRLVPGDEYALHLRFDRGWRRRDVAQAAEAADALAAHWPDEPGTLARLALLAASRRRWADAESLARAALARDPVLAEGDAWAPVALACALRATGRSAEAARVLVDALAQAPTLAHLREALDDLAARRLWTTPVLTLGYAAFFPVAQAVPRWGEVLGAGCVLGSFAAADAVGRARLRGYPASPALDDGLPFIGVGPSRAGRLCLAGTLCAFFVVARRLVLAGTGHEGALGWGLALVLAPFALAGLGAALLWAVELLVAVRVLIWRRRWGSGHLYG